MVKRASDKANERGEAFVKGRREGVEGTHGKEGKPYRGVDSKWSGQSAEATNLAKDDNHDSGGHEELAAAARSMYQAAVKNKGDKDGDQALTER